VWAVEDRESVSYSGVTDKDRGQRKGSGVGDEAGELEPKKSVTVPDSHLSL
jgi:hypothetical protein